ncbi:maleylpyruvate isomerase family mycothiol-dependent enzyme [Actinoplanes sp. LDG1-06]|uniref:Maleylpyruvate isomerase family mycothiol-dependent enzyme n=1 Tax=Paractinoplanes ovalisporus TaxID=2810368 RepID=A0ABS2A6D6_9ACTN|nr:maleylpyruvate isomerase family mycothiol-dependent enzyme [Actinoplanes ovalisporus]MBM2615400.1 maleylpyruvate isomerase family mycothiol-dependent enzyme [Actinoplanes ovalisporus]
MDFPGLITLIDERSAALRDAVAAAAVSSDARVPGCPEWSLGDLVAHLGAVQRFWSVVVRAGDPTGPPSASSLGDREPRGDLLEWSAESTRMLLTALRSSPADAPAWAWWGASSAPLTVGAIARHQVQEAAVHAYDAQETIGKPEPLPSAVAADGVAEFVQVGVGSLGEWPHRPARIAFDAVDGPSHVLDLTPAGGRLDPAASGEPVVTVRGSGSDLVLALYGRVPFDDLRVDGDREVLTRLRAWSNPD